MPGSSSRSTPTVGVGAQHRLRDAVAASEYGADALGFVFYKGSPRYISPEDAASITINIPPMLSTIGVFVNEDPAEVKRIMKLSNIENILKS